MILKLINFIDVAEGAGNQRPDIFLRNPRGLGRQIIIDVAVTGLMVNLEQATKRPSDHATTASSL